MSSIAVKWKLDVAYDRCTGCRACEIACSIRHEGGIIPSAARIRIRQFYPGPMDIPIVCHQCSDTPCVDACPPKIKAIRFDKEAGALRVDPDRCLGSRCGRCAAACRHKEAISFHPKTGKALVCDLCGGHPACAEACPVGALTFLPGAVFDGIHYARSAPEKIARSLSARFYPAKSSCQNMGKG